MPKASPALLAALLATALVAPASVGGVSLLDTTTVTEPSVGVSDNTSRVLRLESIEAAGFGEPQVVVLDATDAQAAELDSAYSVAALDARLTDAPNTTVRRQIVRNYTEMAAADVRDLQAAEQEARQAYRVGDITAEQYARRMAVIHARASALASFIGGRGDPGPSLYTYASPYNGLQNRVAFLYEELQYLTGPVRNELAAAVQGNRGPVTVHVAAGEDGFEFAYIRNDGVYVRSAYRADNIDDDTTGAGGIELLIDIAPVLYPWATNAGSLSGTPIPEHGTIRTTIFHAHGRLHAYIDETTEKVYYEVQYKRLETLPAEISQNETRNGTAVFISRTYPGGPLRVQLQDVSGENTTAITDASVTINGTTTGRTNSDGVAWFVSPRGTYNVTTAYNGTEFNVNVTA